MNCTNCGVPMRDDAKFCTNCGAKAPAAPVWEALKEQAAPMPEVIEPPKQAEAPVEETLRCAFCGEVLSPGLRFCTNCGRPTDNVPAPQPVMQPAPQTEEKGAIQYEKPKKKKRGGRKVLILLIVLFALLTVALGGGYLLLRGIYADGMALLNEMDFAGAQEKLDKIPGAESRYADAFMLIDAGLLMEDGKFDKAIKAFTRLGEYENAAECCNEAKYRKAESLLKTEAFDEAAEQYDALGAYKDSADKLITAQLGKANALIAANKDAEALTLLQSLAAKGSAEAQKKIDQLKQTLYEAAAVAYRGGAYDEAAELFRGLGTYERCTDYLKLIELHQTLEGGAEATEEMLWDELVPRIGLEDTNALILSSEDMTYWFMSGDWKSADEGRYFELTPATDGDYYNVHYNFPWFATDGYFSIEKDGYYTETDSSNKTYDTLRFTIIDQDTVEIYCFKDASTTLVYRQ